MAAIAFCKFIRSCGSAINLGRSIARRFSKTLFGRFGEVRRTRYRYVRVCTRRFAFFIGFALPLGPLRFFFFANYTRTAYQNVTSPTSTDRAISSAQVALDIIKSVASPNHGPLLSAPFMLS